MASAILMSRAWFCSRLKRSSKELQFNPDMGTVGVRGSSNRPQVISCCHYYFGTCCHRGLKVYDLHQILNSMGGLEISGTGQLSFIAIWERWKLHGTRVIKLCLNMNLRLYMFNCSVGATGGYFRMTWLCWPHTTWSYNRRATQKLV